MALPVFPRLYSESGARRTPDARRYFAPAEGGAPSKHDATLGGNEAVRAASNFKQQSSDLFRELRYEEDIVKAGHLLSRIADIELKALAQMERGWEIVQQLPKERQRGGWARSPKGR